MKTTPEQRRHALRTFMESRGLKVKPWCDRAGVNANALYNFLSGRSGSLSQDTLERLAAAESVPVAKIMGSDILPQAPIMLTVLGRVAAGVWMDAAVWPEDQRYEVPVATPARYADKAFCLAVEGESMNREYKAGTILTCVQLLDYDGALQSGDHVIAHRFNKDGQVEATVKELVIEGDRAWLWPRSDRPEFQQPVEIPWPFLGEDANDTEVESIEITAIVIGAYISRIAF